MVKIWDSESGREILSLRGHSAFVTCVGFCHDGRRLVTGSWDNTAKVWEAVERRVSPQELERQRIERFRQRLNDRRVRKSAPWGVAKLGECPNCQVSLRFPGSARTGDKVKCGACGTVFIAQAMRSERTVNGRPVECPKCHTSLYLPDTATAGDKIECGTCGTTFILQ